MHKIGKYEYSGEAWARAKDIGERIGQAIIRNMKKANELGIEDMTSHEADEYLKRKEKEEPGKQK